MIADQRLFLTQLVTLVAVLDPVGHLTLFLTATSRLTATERRRAALAAVGLALLVLITFGWLGQYLLDAMGISLLSFQIAGGVIIFLFALTMVLGSASATVEVSDAGWRSVAVYPLAVPVLAGPGSLLTVMVLVDNNRFSPVDQVLTLGALLIVLAVLLGVFLLAEPLSRLLGGAGTNLLRRVMGLVLAALAVNLVLNAVSTWLHLSPP
jgi:multiple antibiotic resistance protein